MLRANAPRVNSGYWLRLLAKSRIVGDLALPDYGKVARDPFRIVGKI